LEMRVGQGYDVHRLTEGRALKLGGVEIPFEKGLSGHSDADVLIHSVVDAMLGACGGGDIGSLFPDTDPKWKNADSRLFLKKALEIVADGEWSVVNIDATVVAESPKLAPYIKEMKNSLAEILTLEPSRINIKATTSEKMGFIGRSEGMACMSVVLLQRGAGQL